MLENEPCKNTRTVRNFSVNTGFYRAKKNTVNAGHFGYCHWAPIYTKNRLNSDSFPNTSHQLQYLRHALFARAPLA
jgi:hypothetical protein